MATDEDGLGLFDIRYGGKMCYTLLPFCSEITQAVL